MGRKAGIITWFSRLKGVGFVRASDAKQDQEIFIHYSAFEHPDAALWVDEGDAVLFDVVETYVGPEAACVTLRETVS